MLKSPDSQRICATSWSLRCGRACTPFIRVPINAAGSPPFVLPQDRGRPAQPPPRIVQCVRGLPRGWADRPKRDLDCDSNFGRADTTRFPLHCNRHGGRRRRRRVAGAADRADEPGCFDDRRRRPDRGRPRPDRRGTGHQGVLARQADLHQPPHQEGDRRGAQRPAQQPARSAGRQGPRQAGQGRVARPDRHLHPSRLHPARASGRLRRLVLPVPRLACTTPRAASGRGRLRRTCRCPPINSSPIPRSGSAKRTRPKFKVRL